MVNVEGQHQLVDAHDWDLAKTIKWIVNPPAAATQLQIVSMKLHLKAKCLELALKLSQMWPSYQGAYFVYATQDAGSLPSLYFRNSMGQYGRLRAQHGSGPTATRFQYVRHVCGASKSDARSLTTWHRSNKDKKVSEVIAFAKQLNMKEALVGGWYQVELFLDNDASDENQPVKSLHRSGGKVSFDNPIVEGADQNFINSWFSMYIKQFLNFDIGKAWLFERF
jgi:hypothetical protein